MPVIDNVGDWHDIVKGKWIILDANVVINILKYKWNDFFDVMKKSDVTLCTIQPILLELGRTNSLVERIKRNNFLSSVTVLPLTVDVLNGSQKIQEKMWLDGFYPEPEDLYLASIMEKYFVNRKTLLVTSNLDDFRKPLFTREGIIILEDKKSICPISLLSFCGE